MKRGQSVSYGQLNSAVQDVRRELGRLGLLRDASPLDKVDVVWCTFPQISIPDALGFYVSETGWLARFFGYEAGHIYIPKWVLAQGHKQKRGSLRGILRHEYGHAVAYRYPKLVRRNGRFREVFGAPHDSEHDGGSWEEHGDDAFVSAYAMTNPCEDFAETFTLWMQHNGERPGSLRHPLVKRKWKFISETVGRIAMV